MLYQLSYTPAGVSCGARGAYTDPCQRVSLWDVCLLHRGQYFLYLTRSGWSRLFFFVV